MEGVIHTVLTVKEVTYLGIFPITNTMLTSWTIVIVIGVTGYFVGKKLTKIPSNTQTFFEMFFSFFLDYMEKILKSRELGKRFFPLIATIFIFILLSNWFSLVPGVGSVFVTVPVPAETNVIHANSVSDFETVEEKMEITNTEESERVSLFYPLSADLNFNLALAIIAFIAITVSGIMYLGIKKYIEKFIVFSSPMNFFSGIIALLLEVTRFVSFSFRLFRNLFTRKTLTLVIIILFLPFLFPLPFMLHQVFFGFIHASFFSLLTLFFIKLAIVEPL